MNEQIITSEKYIEKAVKEYWKEYGVAEAVIVFFFQKYEDSENWEYREELAMCTNYSADESDVLFLSDFCEGQTMVQIVHIVPLDEVTSFYAENKKFRFCHKL